MEPTYEENDRVLTFNWLRIKLSDVIVFRQTNKYLIKRVDQINGRKIYASGDNNQDSVKLEPINFNQVVGKVVLKY